MERPPTQESETTEDKGARPSSTPEREAGAESRAVGEIAFSYDLRQLKTRGALDGLPVTVVSPAVEPFYEAQHAPFSGYELNAVLRMNSRLASIDRSAHSLRFVCIDGYSTVYPFKAIEGGRGVIAFKKGTDSVPAWPSTKRGQKEETAAPYYLVWDKESYDKHRPWPYQLTRIEVVRNAALAAAHAPPEGANVDAGYTLFKQHCVACHAVNMKGGKMGPELNVPLNILEYRDPQQLARFIAHPQAFRHGSLMPKMPLSAEQISQVLSYLAAMKNRKICASVASCAEVQARKR